MLSEGNEHIKTIYTPFQPCVLHSTAECRKKDDLLYTNSMEKN
jgi:hypothetical protein